MSSNNTDAKIKVDAYFNKEQPFKQGIAFLRKIALNTELTETCKWGAPVYTINNKNVIGILAFKHHFGIWFYNGALLKDPKKVLLNAQEGKTKAMRHWKFLAVNDINKETVTDYILEAIENQKKGIEVAFTKNTDVKRPEILTGALDKNIDLKRKFNSFTPYKQKEFITYINEAKRDATKLNRLAKCITLIQDGIGLHDKYRK